ncbi:MAG: hypothetical protein IJK63_09740 [Oscillospiraceae bacterium]|nr:hypothetical protein [Oscillospiraceae bacterium]
MSDRRRAMMLQTAGGGTVDVLFGHATADDKSLTLPIPLGYDWYAFMSDVSQKTENNEVLRRAQDAVGWLCDKTNTVNVSRDGTQRDIFITRSDDSLTINGYNGNTSGKIVAGVDYTYIAWKES